MKDMIILDANAVLRYLLKDNNDMAVKVDNVIKTDKALVTIELIAEVVYVLKRVYLVSREEIGSVLLQFLLEVHANEKEVLILGLETYIKQNLDFVDCILYAYNCVKKYEILTFDKKLKRQLDCNVD